MDTEKLAFGFFGIACGFILLGLTVFLGFNIVSTYNDRKECQKLGVPLYRCQSNSVQADVKVGK